MVVNLKNSTVSKIMLLLLLSGLMVFAFEFNVKPAKAWTGTVYIRADGSIDPPDAPIVTYDNIIYTLTDNITSFADGIVVERDNIIIDGAGYTVQGTGTGTGIDLSSRINVTLKNINLEKFGCGIYFLGSSKNRIYGNNITNNREGIRFWISSNNVLRNNSMLDNQYSLRVWGWNVSDYVNDIDASNTVDGKPVYYWINRRDMAVPYDGGFVALVNCTCITVEKLHLTKGGQSILLAYTTNSIITRNNITNNYYGIWLYSSNSNLISGNTLTNNAEAGLYMRVSSNNRVYRNNITNSSIRLYDSSNYNLISGNNITKGGLLLECSSNHNVIFGNNITGRGIVLEGSSRNTISGNNITNSDCAVGLAGGSNNKFYHNNFINNTKNVYIHVPGCANFWDDGYPSGGNYWSNYMGVDEFSGPYQDLLGSDGIGDTPYIIDENNKDRYPLMKPLSPPPPDYPFAEWIESPNYTPADERNITYIVIHVMDGYFEGTIDWFQNPDSQASAHYLVSQEGGIVQMVREKDIAWHAGNWEYNQRSIGIEHEDKGNWDKPNWATEELYQASAALVRYLCDKYGIPKDRNHIIGHNEVPGVTKPCPGPYWDWDYFMGLVKGVPAPRKFWAVWENVDYPVLILSNSTVSNFTFDQPEAKISFNLTGPSGAKGFCNVTIPKNLLKDNPWTITVNGVPITDFSKTENDTHSFIYFTYTHTSTLQVTIQGTWVVPEFPTHLTLLAFVIIITIPLAFIKKKRNRKTRS